MLINLFVDMRECVYSWHDSGKLHSIPLQFREKTLIVRPPTPTSSHRHDRLDFIQLPIITHPHGVDISSDYDSNGGNASRWEMDGHAQRQMCHVSNATLKGVLTEYTVMSGDPRNRKCSFLLHDGKWCGINWDIPWQQHHLRRSQNDMASIIPSREITSKVPFRNCHEFNAFLRLLGCLWAASWNFDVSSAIFLLNWSAHKT